MVDKPHHRISERKHLAALLQAGSNILMLAPRRIGKTWLMDKIKEDMAASGWLCIKIDVEGMRTENEFLRALCQEIEKTQALTDRVKSHLFQRFKQLTTHVQDGNLAAAIGTVDPREFLETLIGSLSDETQKTLILIDEIALFIHERAKADPDETRSLLYHLRKLQQTYPKVRWFLTGSVGLDVIARRHDMLGALLGIDTFPLDPFSTEAARSYLAELRESGQATYQFDMDGETFEHLARELGWLSPYYLRQIALQIRPTGSTSSGLTQATIADIERAISQLLSPTQRLHFSAWEEHIRKNFDALESERLQAILDVACDEADGEIAATILTRLSQSGHGPSKRELSTLLSSLETDGFLHRVADRWAFRSGLLRRYWKEYLQDE